jgi:cellulose synthase/poly-beta-1,6-N-acetylglucosamine synthase-like glycosyltransferase
MLEFINAPSHYLHGDLFVGRFEAPVKFTPPITTQSLFLIFILSVLIAAKTSLEIRLKMLVFAGLMFVGFIVTQFATINVLSAIGAADEIAFTRISLITSALVAGGIIELALFSTLTLPKPTKIKKVIQRSYKEEYLITAALLLASFITVYFILHYLDIRNDTVASAYAAGNIASIISFRYYLAYFIYEVLPPRWTRWKENENQHIPVSFLLPAFNEEKTVKQLIESIDKAATKYKGPVEIVLVNDGSTDRTGEIAAQAFEKLKIAKYKQFNIPNSGKGFALKFGLKNTSGEVIFRIDADSVIHEDAILKIMRHFRDPTVGSVSGMIFPLEEKSIWQKSMVLLGAVFLYYKRGQELIDSILCQPGAFSVFRKEALVKAGGWAENQFGEDGEITVRIGRYGYRSTFEQQAVAFSEAPSTLRDLRHQRLRWGIAYYYSRARNMEIIRDFEGPRSIMYFLNILTHGAGFVHAVMWPFLLMAGLLGLSAVDFGTITRSIGIPLQVTSVLLLVIIVNITIYAYFLVRFHKTSLMKYIPFMSVLSILLAYFLKPEALGILLNYSAKYKVHKKENYDVLRKNILKGF